MIVDSRQSPDLVTLPFAFVYRPLDRHWFDRESDSWVDFQPGWGFDYEKVDAPITDGEREVTLAISTPIDRWGTNHDVVVYVLYCYDFGGERLVDRLFYRVNPTFQIHGNHWVTIDRHEGHWYNFQPHFR